MGSYILDENLSYALAPRLGEISLRAISIIEIPIITKPAPDIEIWNYAKAHNYSIITKDSDFLHLSNLKGCPPKVIRLNCGNKSTDYIYNLLKARKGDINEFETSNECYLEII